MLSSFLDFCDACLQPKKLFVLSFQGTNQFLDLAVESSEGDVNNIRRKSNRDYGDQPCGYRMPVNFSVESEAWNSGLFERAYDRDCHNADD